MRRRDRLRSVRAVKGGNEDDFVESDVIAHRFGNEKMSVMNRIETAAKDSDINEPSP
jgi:phage regulator Rha-like protein